MGALIPCWQRDFLEGVRFRKVTGDDFWHWGSSSRVFIGSCQWTGSGRGTFLADSCGQTGLAERDLFPEKYG